MPVLEVRDLRVELVTSRQDIVADISLTVETGDVLGLVGESGSGKTTVGLAILGDTRVGAKIVAGEVIVDGTDVLKASASALRMLRGRTVAYIPQDPSVALNPALRLRRQLVEGLAAHGIGADERERLQRVRALLEEAGLPADDAFLARYPHQVSGGQQQRVVIAMAFLCTPKVIVCDEPTTGLDVTTQARILQMLRSLCATHGVAAIYISHDLAVVANLADRVTVMYAGRLAEIGSRQQIFAMPAHPYTQRLIRAIPDVSGRRGLEPIAGFAPSPGRRPAGCSFAPRCQHMIDTCTTGEPQATEIAEGHWARCLRAEALARTDSVDQPASLSRRATRADAHTLLRVDGIEVAYGRRRALHGVSLEVGRGECLALVGESGSGKTTLARALVGLIDRRSGEIEFDGQHLAHRARDRPDEVRRTLQYVFQNPYSSLNPRRSVADALAVPLRQFFGLTGGAARKRIDEALEMVALTSTLASRYPDQISGGERQRVAIARALVCEPKMLICDEITSALDVSVQAAIVRLLEELRGHHDLSLLFVTHNLALVRSIADRIAVLRAGSIVETGDCDDLLEHAKEPYTRTLIADTPVLAVLA